MLKRESGMIATDTFLDGAVESFNFWNMFVARADTEDRTKVGDIPMHGFELVIGDDDGDAEAPSHICPNDGTEVLEDVLIFHGV